MQRLVAGGRPYLLLILLCLAAYLPGLAAIPPLDRDESRFAQASRQMLESGDFVRVQFQNESRAKKPAGIYWLQAASAELTGAENAIWAYRLPSVLGAIVAVLLCFHFGGALVGRPAALMGAALLAVCFMLVSEAHQAKTDAVLLACAVAAQGALGRFYLAARRGETSPHAGIALVFWLAQASGILVKGPIVPMVSLLTLATLWIADRRIGWLRGLRPLAGVIGTVVLVAPWAIAVSLATRGQFLGEAVQHDLLAKMIEPAESHEGMFGTYLLAMTGTLWPASLVVLPAFVRAVRSRAEPALRFCLAWIVPSWIVFELVPTKLPHYVLPLYPALALLAGAIAIAGEPLLRRWWAKIVYVLCALLGVILAAACIVAPLRLGDGFAWASVPAALVAATAGLAPALLAWRERYRDAVWAGIAGAALTWILVFQGVVPRLDRMWLSQDIADAVPAGTPVAAAGYREPSLVFLLGTDTLLTDGPGAADFLAAHPQGMAVIANSDEPAFDARLQAIGHRARKVAEADGINYSRGRPTTLILWALEPAS